MTLKVASSPHLQVNRSTGELMRLVIYAMIPGLVAQWYFFGWGVWIQAVLAIATALASEALVMHLRQRPILPRLADGSAILTALLLAASIPPYAPWWMVIIGSAVAIILAKQLYGGLGHNLFNPAMVAYVLLLIAFPVQMTSWLPPESLRLHDMNLADAINVIFTGFTREGYSLEQLRMDIDGITMATPLDTLKTNLTLGLTISESFASPLFGKFGGRGWEVVNLMYWAGGMWLLKRKVIAWQIPVAFLTTLLVLTLISFWLAPDNHASPLFHMLSGGTMLGAFFILTDPVSAATSPRGRLIYGSLIALLVYLIRSYGGYPDAIAFAVLLANMCVPLIDHYSRPAPYGHPEDDR